MNQKTNKQKARYWISTMGRKPLVFKLYTRLPAHNLTTMYGIKECNWITYWLFKHFKVNLLVQDKLRWLRN